MKEVDEVACMGDKICRYNFPEETDYLEYLGVDGRWEYNIKMYVT